MKTLEGYIVAKTLVPQEDIMHIEHNRIFFNKADALEAAKGALIFKIVIPIPQDGKGGDEPKESLDFFNQFWKAYPNKKAKPVAFKKWKALKVDDELFQKIMSALEAHKKTPQWTKDNGQFIPHPSTWLNQRRWEDELKVEKSSENQSKFGHL